MFKAAIILKKFPSEIEESMDIEEIKMFIQFSDDEKNKVEKNDIYMAQLAYFIYKSAFKGKVDVQDFIIKPEIQIKHKPANELLEHLKVMMGIQKNSET